MEEKKVLDIELAEEHEHHHEHEHDEQCTCGCHDEHTHHHEHEHDEQCTCGCHDEHEHHHEHEHDHLYRFEVTTHESAVICTYMFELDENRSDAEELTERFISVLGTAVSANGGFIGHIKASVVFANEGVRISLTDECIDKQCFSQEHACVEGVAIVFMIAPDMLEDITVKAFETIGM